MNKISSIVLYILAAISIVLAGLFFFGPKLPENDAVPTFYDENLAWAAILIGLTVVITIFFAIEFIITHPKALKGALVAIVCGAVLVGVAYLLASDAPVAGIEEGTITAVTSKWVDVGIILMYILGGLAIVAMIGAEIVNALK